MSRPVRSVSSFVTKPRPKIGVALGRGAGPGGEMTPTRKLTNNKLISTVQQQTRSFVTPDQHTTGQDVNAPKTAATIAKNVVKMPAAMANAGVSKIPGAVRSTATGAAQNVRRIFVR
jgi:hypothetical protein